MVPGATWPGSDQRPWGTALAGCPSVFDLWCVVCFNLYLGHLGCACACGVHESLALAQRCACPVCCVYRANGSWALVHQVCVLCVVCSASMAPWRSFTCVRICWNACAMSMAPWRPFTGARALFVVFAVSMAPWCYFAGVRSWCVVCALSLALWRSFTGLRAWCDGCSVSMAPWHLFTGVYVFGVLHAWSRWLLGARSPVHAPCVLCVRRRWLLGVPSPACAIRVRCH